MLFLMLGMNDWNFQHPWLLKPHFIDGYRKYLKGQDRVETDQFFQDDPDEIEDDLGGTRTQRRIKPSAKSTMTPSIRSLAGAGTPQAKISKYFSTIDDSDDDASENTDRTELVTKAMKKEWWYDMFDVDRSQFDVSLCTKPMEEFPLLSFRSNFRVNSNYSERFSMNVNPSVISYWYSLEVFLPWIILNNGFNDGVLDLYHRNGSREWIISVWMVQ